MVVDPFTKTLPAKSFMGHVTSMGLRVMPNLLRAGTLLEVLP